VTLEIIIDLPFGFPINNIISLSDMVFEKNYFPIILLNVYKYMGRYLIDINTLAHTHTFVLTYIHTHMHMYV